MSFEKWTIRKGDSMGTVYEAYWVARRLSMAKFFTSSYRDGFILVLGSAYRKKGDAHLDALFNECWKKPRAFYQIDEDGIKVVGRRAPNFG